MILQSSNEINQKAFVAEKSSQCITTCLRTHLDFTVHDWDLKQCPPCSYAAVLPTQPSIASCEELQIHLITPLLDGIIHPVIKLEIRFNSDSPNHFPGNTSNVVHVCMITNI